MSFERNPSNWKPPAGLGYSTMRPVSLTGQGIAMAVAGVVFLVGAPLLGMFIANRTKLATQRELRLEEQGVQTTAVITRVWRSGGKDSKNMVAYRFSAGDSQIENQV